MKRPTTKKQCFECKKEMTKEEYEAPPATKTDSQGFKRPCCEKCAQESYDRLYGKQ